MELRPLHRPLRSPPRRPTAWAFAFALLAPFLVPSFAHAWPGAGLHYGQSEEYWRYRKSMKDPDTTTTRGREIIRELFTNYELAFTRVDTHSDVKIERDPEPAEPPWPTRFEFTIQAEGASVINSRREVNNGNELRMGTVAGGVFKGNYNGNIAEDFYFMFGFAIGAGQEEKVILRDNGSTINRTRSRAVLGLVGLDLKLQKIWRLGSVRLVNSLQTEETYFRTFQERFEGQVDWNLRDFSHDWKFRTDFLYSWFNAHFIGGAHPYPGVLLPRTWNRVSEISASNRRIQSFMGGGVGATIWVSARDQMALMGGYYAGAPGGELRYRFGKSATLNLSIYNVDNSSSYQQLTQRVYYGGIDFVL